MEAFVRGSRSSAQDWARAQRVPLNEIPPLDEDQKAMAMELNVSEEDYARSAYAGRLSQQKLLQMTLSFGRWLNAKIQERSVGDRVETIELDTWSGKFQAKVLAGREIIEFGISEDLVERFLTTGSAESERSLLRLLEIFLPQERAVRAS